MESVAKAHTNIALIKYWGKRDEQLFLPMNNSISITLDRFYTVTSVRFDRNVKKDTFLLNGEEADEKETRKVASFLDRVRKLANKDIYATVTSENKVPTAAGFASSASGFAALAAAATKAIGLNVDEKMLSIIARQGSGSACRSIFGGYVEWYKGINNDGSDSFAQQILDEKKWDLSILSVLLGSKPKKVLSREGMKRTVETSPFYNGWLDTIDDDLKVARSAIINRNFELLGKIVEANALKMHATTLGSNPPFMYWQGGTIDVMERVQELRESGISAYFTIDAGPNVKVLCLPKDEKHVKEALSNLTSVQDVVHCHPGPGVTYLPPSTI